MTKRNNLVMEFYLLMLLAVTLTSCSSKKETGEENIFYVCSMDPQVMEKKMGFCPICKMELSKIILTKEDLESNSIMLNESQIKLANIMTDSIKIRSMSEEQILTGTLRIAENKGSVISSKIDGRIQQLFVKSLGDQIKEGQVLYEIYSDELLSAQKEYQLVLSSSKGIKSHSNDYNTLIGSAKNRLLLMGMTQNQVELLTQEKAIHDFFPVVSPLNGTVTGLFAKEGDYVTEGSGIMELTDLSSLWVEVQMYTGETTYLREQEEAEIIIPSVSEEIIKGTIGFINPQLQEGSRISAVRIEIKNPEMIYKPGMLAYIILHKNRKTTLAVPTRSVIYGAGGSLVWKRSADGKFEFCLVTTGIQNNRLTEITSGISEGEVIVTSGAYLLNSVFVFKKGMDPLSHLSHQMK